MTKCEEGAGGTVWLPWNRDEVMRLNISVRTCSLVHTWPGTTALENSLFSWTSSLGVVSNLSAMLFNVSRDSTWTRKTKRQKKKGITRAALFTKKLQMKGFKAETRFQWTLRNRQKPLEWNQNENGEMSKPLYAAMTSWHKNVLQRNNSHTLSWKHKTRSESHFWQILLWFFFD